MEDPRVAELMDYTDAVDEDGNLTSIALIARRVEGYLDGITELRQELDAGHSTIEELEVRAANLRKTLAERDELRDEMEEDAQTAIVKSAAPSATSAREATLRKEAMEKQQALSQFDADYDVDRRRLDEAMRALEGRLARQAELREQIARRMNIVDALLQRAEVEWPSYYFDENERIRSQNQRSAAPAASASRRRSRRGAGAPRRTTIIRRKKAS